MSIIEFSSIQFHITKSAPREGRIYLPSITVSALLLFYFLADVALLEATGIATEHAGKLVFGVGALCVLTVWIFIRRLDARLGSFATATGALITLAILGVPFAYGMTALARFPLEDTRILELDRLIGFDWRGFVGTIDRYPNLCALLGWSYATIWLQLLFIAIFAATIRDHATIDELIFAVGASLITVNVIALLVPTAGVTTLVQYDFANLNNADYLIQTRHAYLALRDGSLGLIDFDNVAALVSFPSFHTVVAVLATLASRRLPYMFGPILALNALMLVSTLSHGGHYLSDVIIGVVIAIVAWRAALSVRGRNGAESAPQLKLGRRRAEGGS
jgi:membrane-associated phospholipid phosphatase